MSGFWEIWMNCLTKILYCRALAEKARGDLHLVLTTFWKI